MSKTELVKFVQLDRPVAFTDSESLYPYIDNILRDWIIEKIESGEENLACMTVRKTQEGFERRSKWLTRPVTHKDPVDVVCDLVVDLIHAFVAENDGLLCLHCAAIEFKKGLVIFPNTYRSGKSTLALKLASCGARLVTDDVLPILKPNNMGMALGILPRLRMPLPDCSGQLFRDFISLKAGPKNRRYLYVDLNIHEQATFGTVLPIKGIVVLQREEDTQHMIRAEKKSRIVKDLILRNFARQNPGLEIIDRLYSVGENADCYTLKYDDLDQAVKVLEDVFG